MKTRALYDSDLTDAEWALIRPLVPPHPPRGNLPWISKREIMNAIFYVDKQGCTWRGMPHDFPAWQTVYDPILFISALPAKEKHRVIPGVSWDSKRIPCRRRRSRDG